MYAAFSNVILESKKVLFVPWKYAFPDNLEDVNQTLEQIESELVFSDYDMVYLLTISRPNELSNIEEIKTLSKLLTYGKANKILEKKKDKFGIIPIGLNDINSYRRYTKILLDMMISLDYERSFCPICGDKLNRGHGGRSNISSCHTCGLEIINTKCRECGEKFAFTRYTLPKTTTETNSDNKGFKVIADEHKFGFKNITDVYMVEDSIHPVCPCCGC